MAGDSTEEKPKNQVLVVDDANEVRDIIVWLLRSGEYRALASADAPLAKRLLAKEHAVLVLSELPDSIFDGWDLLAFCHARCPNTPVLIISKTAIAKRPEVERLTSCIPRRSCDAARFRVEIRRHLISRATAR